MTEHADVLVIGAGAAGSTAAREIARAGRHVIVAEPDRVGGTCLWRGCIPKKALYHAAAVARNSRRAEQFGVECESPDIDWATVLAWKWHSQETYAGDQDGILKELGIERISAPARFLNAAEVAVGDRTLRPDVTIVATGAVPVKLQVPGAELADTSDAALRYQTLPESLCIIGAGYIAFEFAGIYASFGTKVTILSRDEELLSTFEPECVALARTGLETLGVSFVTGAELTGLSGSAGEITVAFEVAGDTRTLTAERVLAAIGRRPAYDELDLQAADITLDSRGTPTLDATLRSTNPTVFFAGDAAAREMHTPVASAHGRAVARTILGGTPVVPDTDGLPFACFTVPELAQTGLTEAEAARRSIQVDAHSKTFEFLGAAVISDVRHGLVKIIAEKDSGVIVGAHIAGERASDLIYPLALAVRTQRTLGEIQSLAAVHPAYTESVNWAAF